MDNNHRCIKEEIINQLRIDVKCLEREQTGIKQDISSIKTDIKETNISIKSMDEKLDKKVDSIEQKIDKNNQVMYNKLDANTKWFIGIGLGILANLISPFLK